MITKLRKNMKNCLMHISDKILLKKRALIETVNDELKNIAQIEHSRHRSFNNFIANALSAIAALLHDIIIVMGVFSLLQKEIDGSFVAAIMTIIGYSINDTIVIFDRIRENLKLHFRKGGDLIELINHSIMQTMTRSIYTVLTVLFTVVSLFVFGGETTKNFALALLIGISCGAYSSIFNASPLWYDLKRIADKKAKTEP